MPGLHESAYLITSLHFLIIFRGICNQPKHSVKCSSKCHARIKGVTVYIQSSTSSCNLRQESDVSLLLPIGLGAIFLPQSSLLVLSSLWRGYEQVAVSDPLSHLRSCLLESSWKHFFVQASFSEASVVFHFFQFVCTDSLR
jgi:hypothetical protein